MQTPHVASVSRRPSPPLTPNSNLLGTGVVVWGVSSGGRRQSMHYRASSSALRAGPASVNLAIPALENAPVGTRMAQVAGPLDQSAVRLDHLERVSARVGDCHGELGT